MVILFNLERTAREPWPFLESVGVLVEGWEVGEFVQGRKMKEDPYSQVVHRLEGQGDKRRHELSYQGKPGLRGTLGERHVGQ